MKTRIPSIEREGRCFSKRFPLVLALLPALLLLCGCAALGGGISQMQNGGEDTAPEETTANSGATAPETTAPAATSAGGAEVTRGEDGSVVVRAGDAEVTTGPGGAIARAGDVVAGPGQASGDGSEGAGPSEGGAAETATLRLAGDPGTAFSGACVAGGEPDVLEGETPARLDYDLNGGGLACDIEKQGPGTLRVALEAGDSNAVRETNADEATISFVYRDGSILASQSLGSASSSSVSSSSSSVSSDSSVQSQSSNSSINQSVSVTN